VIVAEGSGLSSSGLAQRLQERGVQTRPFFLGMHEQPAFHKMGLFAGERYPVSERLARRGLYLPSGVALTEFQVAEVSAAVLERV
jgi:perosamine synthetase